MQPDKFLGPSEAAERLGVSAKALRLYERHGMLTPVRTEAGWRTYGPTEMKRAAEIVALRRLHLSLSEVARVIAGDAVSLESALTAHASALVGQIHHLSETVERVRGLRARIAKGGGIDAGEITGFLDQSVETKVTFDLPWPWGGEAYEVRDIRSLNYIVGPLGSGKTRFAMAISGALPDAIFLGLDRLEVDEEETRPWIDSDPELKARVERTMNALAEAGATRSSALRVLVGALEFNASRIVVVDMVEQDLDRATQEALIKYLRHRPPRSEPLFLMTRSTSILDLTAMGRDEALYLCPANHSPPVRVAPNPGAFGYEAVETCLAPPEVRERTKGVVASRLERV